MLPCLLFCSAIEQEELPTAVYEIDLDTDKDDASSSKASEVDSLSFPSSDVLKEGYIHKAPDNMSDDSINIKVLHML